MRVLGLHFQASDGVLATHLSHFSRMFDRIVTGDWPTQVTNYVANLPLPVVVALLLLPIGLALVSRRITAVVSVLPLAGLVWMAISKPAVLCNFAATGIYLASLLVAIMAMLSARKQRRINNEMATLRAEVTRLQQAEQQRFIADLKSRTGKTSVLEPNSEDSDG